MAKTIINSENGIFVAAKGTDGKKTVFHIDTFGDELLFGEKWKRDFDVTVKFTPLTVSDSMALMYGGNITKALQDMQRMRRENIRLYLLSLYKKNELMKDGDYSDAAILGRETRQPKSEEEKKRDKSLKLAASEFSKGREYTNRAMKRGFTKDEIEERIKADAFATKRQDGRAIMHTQESDLLKMEA